MAEILLKCHWCPRDAKSIILATCDCDWIGEYACCPLCGPVIYLRFKGVRCYYCGVPQEVAEMPMPEGYRK